MKTVYVRLKKIWALFFLVVVSCSVVAATPASSACQAECQIEEALPIHADVNADHCHSQKEEDKKPGHKSPSSGHPELFCSLGASLSAGPHKVEIGKQTFAIANVFWAVPSWVDQNHQQVPVTVDYHRPPIHLLLQVFLI